VQELQQIVAGRDPGPESRLPDSTEAGPGPKTTVWLRKEIIALTLSYFTYGYVAWIYFSWFYIYLVQVRGLNLKTSAVYSMFPFIAMTLGSLTGGVVSDWLSRTAGSRIGRCFLPACALGSTAVLLLAGSQSHSAQTASLILACGAGALYLSQSCYWSVATDIAGKQAAVVAAVVNMGGQLGGAVTASLTPLIAMHLGWNVSFFAAAALAALGAIAWLTVDPHTRLAEVGSL
jgi:ACS family glucarate transporter-like MFS transporter